jgi:hypothetical protein
MGIRRILLIQSVIALIICGSIGLSSSGEEETVSFSGTIQSISKDSKSITVNDKGLAISGDMKIVDQNGNPLRLSDIKPDASVAIDAVALPKGYRIKKIVIVNDRGV